MYEVSDLDLDRLEGDLHRLVVTTTATTTTAAITTITTNHYTISLPADPRILQRPGDADVEAGGAIGEVRCRCCCCCCGGGGLIAVVVVGFPWLGPSWCFYCGPGAFVELRQVEAAHHLVTGVEKAI
jgi:hypothetical protein